MSTPIQISARIRDAWGTETSTLIYGQMDSTEDLSAVDALAQSVLGALDGCTDGQIIGAHVTVPILLTGVKTAATPGSRVEQTGLLGFSATGTTRRFTLAIPSVANGIMDVDRITLTVGSPANILVTHLLNPVGNMTFNGCNAHNQTLTDLVDASVSTRKKRRQLQRSSFEVA